MTTVLRNFWHTVSGRSRREPAPTVPPIADQPQRTEAPALDIAPDDPIVAYFQSAGGAVDLEKVDLDSPALQALKAAGVKIAVPLVSQGELLGLLNLGQRLSQQDYSADDRVLLTNLATQAAPALRVAQLVREQQAEVRARERIEQELRVARLIQQTLLPKENPALPGWQVDAKYQPAREVGGDFYDFLYLPDGRLGIIVGDVTDKGVPAALVMATTRSILRAAAQRIQSPGEVLARANDLLDPDIPPNMFVTCLYAILDPATGRLHYANAGHDLPYRRHGRGVDELRARGMPLGLLPGMTYEENETTLAPGDSVLLYSDGLVEAHNHQRDMFSFPRLRDLVGSSPVDGGAALIDFLMDELAEFTGPDWEQEDDITLVTIQRTASAPGPSIDPEGPRAAEQGQPGPEGTSNAWRSLGEWTIPSEPDNERLAMDRVVEAIRGLNLPARRLERLKTAVAEATMNAMEHGNHYQPDLPVMIQVLASDAVLAVRITDQGGDKPIPEPDEPDLEAKLAGLQKARGWGLFLIKNLVDDMNVTSDEDQHTIELILKLEGDEDAGENS